MSVQTMETMVKWVDNNVLENPTLESMSSFVGYSPYYCSIKFREYTGLTYKQYLAKCKLNAAAEMLRASDEKIVDIAFKCGYLSPESLTRAFTEMFKCTPSQYRNSEKGAIHD